MGDLYRGQILQSCMKVLGRGMKLWLLGKEEIRGAQNEDKSGGCWGGPVGS